MEENSISRYLVGSRYVPNRSRFSRFVPRWFVYRDGRRARRSLAQLSVQYQISAGIMLLRIGFLVSLSVPAVGFTAGLNAATIAPVPSLAHRVSVPIVMEDGPAPANNQGALLRSAFLGLIALQSGVALVDEVPGLLGPDADIFGTIFDAGFLLYASKLLLNQAGVVSDVSTDEEALAALNGFECTVTMSVGREPNTWMPAEWAASGGRLSLPMKLRFSDEEVDLGVPGEQEMGGRYVRKLYCDGGRFIGPQGEVNVGVNNGGWSIVGPKGGAGETKLRLFLDFPEEVVRNDVSIPAGRVYLSTACWQGEEVELTVQIVEAAKNLASLLMVPGGAAALLTEGGLTIKRNGARNLWGTLGDVFFILGRFTLSEIKLERKEGPETPQEKAARERAEDAARGRKL